MSWNSTSSLLIFREASPKPKKKPAPKKPQKKADSDEELCPAKTNGTNGTNGTAKGKTVSDEDFMEISDSGSDAEGETKHIKNILDVGLPQSVSDAHFRLINLPGGFAKKIQAKTKKAPPKKLTSPSDLFDNMLSGDKKVAKNSKPAKEKVSKPKVRMDVGRTKFCCVLGWIMLFLHCLP